MVEAQLKVRTKNFAHDCVKLAIVLPSTDLGRHIGRQLIRSATSVAANYRATCIAQTKRSFISKLSIVIEEIDESNFWLEFLKEEKVIDSTKVGMLINESDELTRIFISSRKTAEKNILSEDIVNYEKRKEDD
ncbi:MAG: four helix bundle protein [Bacteroidetes bacterium HGW-Bacteroidetes-17]|nr:MAG: four helix bundle protein [Bacteroidetes bacterium HGW-Bacteroidetes-17]